MKYLFYLLLISLVISCSSNDDNEKINNAIIDTSIDISYFNKDSLDLLDQKKDYAYNEKNIELFYIDNNKKTKIFNANLDYPKGFKVFKHEVDNIHRIAIFGKNDKTKKRDTILIKLNEKEIDTLVYTTKYTNNVEEITKVWYNDVIKWEVPYTKERYFSIFK